jgi:glycerophosphoryl diester phosphodiesterase
MILRHALLFALSTALLPACMPPQRNDRPEVHGHRGCRGLLPENSIDGFKKAVELGCDQLELDVVLSADGQVVVSHEPWMHATICQLPDGRSIAPEQAMELNLFRMTLAEIQRYDCGSLPHPDFPDQDLRRSVKPSLMQVVEAADEHALLSGNVSPGYNIEIKSDPALYDTHQPRPAAFVAAVIATIDSLGISERCQLQSFDPAILEAVHLQRPDLRVALLVENADDLATNLGRLSFAPQAYSPAFELATPQLLAALRAKDIELVVWTVNEPQDIERMIDLGVDGIISDHPERVIAALEAR